jgi:hypothetical protein
MASWLYAAQAAGTATLTLSPPSASYPVNTNFTLTVNENSGSQAVSSVEANVTYDASKLQFVSLSTANSPFPNCFQASGGNGSVTISCAYFEGTVTGNQPVGTITFKALAGSGTTSINFRADSAVVAQDATNIWNNSTTGGTYTLTTPSSGGSTSTTPTGGSTTTTPSTGTKVSTKPVSDYSAAAPQAQTANPATPVPVEESTSKGQFNGYLVAIKVVDADGKPVKDAKVTMADKTATTDGSGVASFSGVAAGKHDISVASKEGEIKSSIDVTKDGTPTDVQQLTVKLKAKETKTSPYVIIIPTILTLLLAGLTVFAYKTGNLTKLGRKFHRAARHGRLLPIPVPDPPHPQTSEERLGKIKVNIPNPSEVIKPHKPS